VEFGSAGPDKVSEYYRGGPLVPATAKSTITTKGTQKFSNYRGAQALADLQVGGPLTVKSHGAKSGGYFGAILNGQRLVVYVSHQRTDPPGMSTLAIAIDFNPATAPLYAGYTQLVGTVFGNPFVAPRVDVNTMKFFALSMPRTNYQLNVGRGDLPQFFYSVLIPSAIFPTSTATPVTFTLAMK
jgi:hypothetical protein